MSADLKTEGGDQPFVMSIDEWEILQGRLAALEVVAAQSWVFMLKLTADDAREELISSGLVYLEDAKFPSLAPLSQHAALQTMESFTAAALRTVRQPGAGK